MGTKMSNEDKKTIEIDLSKDTDEVVDAMKTAEGRGQLDLSRGVYSDVISKKHEKTLIDCGSGIVVECEIYIVPGEQPVIDFLCPRCGGKLVIDGKKKPIRVDRFQKRPRRVSNGDTYMVSRAVSILEVIACPYPIGKTTCGWRAKVTDGFASQV